MRSAPAAKYAFPVTFMCRILTVSTSGYYEWRARPESATARRRKALTAQITDIFEISDATYGHRRVKAQLERNGVEASLELVRFLMREAGLVPCQPKAKRRHLTDNTPGEVPDLVGRDFTAPVPGVKFVGDVTYIWTGEGWSYLATVLDCCTKEVVGYALGEHFRTDLIIEAMEMARRDQHFAPGAIFHSDRGSNYMSGSFAAYCRRYDLRKSVGRTGVCWDNAMAESFFGVLKNELVSRVSYATRAELKQDIMAWIELWYNRRRLHSANGYRPPIEVRESFEPARS
ncbi:IS3 family transposase [Glycomyces albus]